MSTREKIDYIWEYYKGWIIGAIFLVIFCVLMIDGFMSKGDEPIGVTILSETSLDGIRKIEDNLSTLPFDIYVDHFYHEDGQMKEAGNQSLERLSTSLAVGQVDLFIMNEILVERMLIEGILLPLSDVLSVSIATFNERDMLVLGDTWYGIRADQLTVFQELKEADQLYITVPATARHYQEVNQLLEKYLIK